MKKGDKVKLTCSHGLSVEAEIILASGNEASLMLWFEGIFLGYVGMMPVLRENGVYRELITCQPVTVELLETSKSAGEG